MNAKHIRSMSKAPSVAQVSNFQVKLEGTTDMIDVLLRAQNAVPWKVIRPIGDDGGTDTDTGTDTGTDTTGTEL